MRSQVLAIVLWCLEDYEYYASCIFVVSAVSLIVETIETRRNMVALRAMIARFDTVRIVRRGTAPIVDAAATATGAQRCVETEETVDVATLLPGDVFVVESGMQVPVDAVLMCGGCLVNESMLTGESLPINKTELPPDGGAEAYVPALHKAHTLFRGTEVVQNRSQKTRALVVRTGFCTAKGDLIRSILFPNESQFQFYRDGLRFLAFMSILAVLGFVYTVVMMWHFGVDAGDIALRGLDLVTTVVPPALPAAMTVGTIYAVARLKKRKIFCISPPRVNVAGKVKLVAFDKTGTLTEDGLHLSHVFRSAGGQLQTCALDLRDAAPADALVQAFACCHSLAVAHVDANKDGDSNGHGGAGGSVTANTSDAGLQPEITSPPTLIGSPLELQLFEACGWELLEPGDGDVPECCRSHPFVRPPLPPAAGGTVGPPARGCSVLRVFSFASQKQRMAVVVADLDSTGASLGTCVSWCAITHALHRRSSLQMYHAPRWVTHLFASSRDRINQQTRTQTPDSPFHVFCRSAPHQAMRHPHVPLAASYHRASSSRVPRRL